MSAASGRGPVVAGEVSDGPSPWPWVAGVAAYALLSYLLMLHAADEPWAVLALLAPGTLALVAAALASRRRGLAALGLLALAGLAALAMTTAAGRVERLYVAQHAGIHLALGWTFAHTLRAGGLPMITAFALRVHRERLTAEMRAYTRRLTRLWCGYFVGMAVFSVLLYLLAPWSAWSLFANLLTPLSAAALFLGEHLVRYRLHPEFDRVDWRAALRASLARDR